MEDGDIQDNENCVMVGWKLCLNFANTSEFSETAIGGVEQKRCSNIFHKVHSEKPVSLFLARQLSFTTTPTTTPVFCTITPTVSFSMFGKGKGLLGQNISTRMTLIVLINKGNLNWNFDCLMFCLSLSLL